MEKMTAGIYIHVPFCVRKCAYCDFYSLPGPDGTLYDRYTDAVCREIMTSSSVYADTIYFGGGTPSLLGAARLTRILDTARTRFDLADDAEITLEANPLDVDDPVRLRAAGFNRVSLGIQSARDGELMLLGRRHTFAQAVETVRMLRHAGFDNLSLDLMYALPNQTLRDWRESVAAIVALEPEHISCYALTLSEGVRLYGTPQPDDNTQLTMFLYADEALARAGYAHYEISNFAQPGYESRHNSKYWLGADYYGFGPAAHSFIAGTRYARPPELMRYLTEMSRTPITSREVTEEHPDAAEEYLMLRLRMRAGIDAADFEVRFGRPFEPFARVLERYIREELVIRDGRRYALTPRGMFVSNAVIAELFADM